MNRIARKIARLPWSIVWAIIFTTIVMTCFAADSGNPPPGQLLKPTDSPTFRGLTLSGATASKPTCFDAQKGVVSCSFLTDTTIPAPSSATPQMDGTGGAGQSSAFARGDHVHPSDTSKANVNADTTGAAGHITGAAPSSLGTTYLSTTKTAGTTGVTQYLLAKIDSTGNVVTASTGDMGILGIAATTAASTTAVEIATRGIINCIADNTTVVGNLAVVGTSTAGRCRNSGQISSPAIPSTTQIVGKFLTVANAGSPASLQLYGPGHYGTGGAVPVVVQGTDITLTASQCMGNFIEMTATGTVNLPPGVQGYNLMVYVSTASAVSLKPAGSEAIVLNGAALTAGHKVTSTSTAGNSVTLVHDGTNWIVLGSSTWTDGGV